MKKIVVTIALFSLSGLIYGQEPVKENNTSKTPPTSGKAINEKGVSPVKTRGLTKKSSTANESKPVADTATVTPTQENLDQNKPQTEPKKEKKEPKKGTGTQKSINEKGVSSPKTRGTKNKKEATPTNTTITQEPKK